MSMNIDNEGLFKAALTNGINLFTGSGFSKLPYNGVSLPDASELEEELCDRYGINKKYKGNLEKICNLINIKSKSDLQGYLRKKFTVNGYNSLYDVINKINIKSYITTNIDNLIQCVFSNSTRYYLHDVVSLGASKNEAAAVIYIPLHGDVNNIDSNLYFGEAELSTVANDNADLFEAMRGCLKKHPTVFLGYGFHDNSVMVFLSKLLIDHKYDIWVMCLSSDDNKDYFRELGCFVIEGTIEDFLNYIDTIDITAQTDVCENKPNMKLKRYALPDRNDMTAITREQYFENCVTDWYCCAYDYPIRTKYYNEVREVCQNNKNVIIVGIQLSGKTTLLMQMALNSNSNLNYYIKEVTKEQVAFFKKQLKGKMATVFVDNCCLDAEASRILMKATNIRFIGVADGFSYESAAHLMSDCRYEVVNISQLSDTDAHKLYEKLPQHIKMTPFRYTDEDEEDDISMLEFLELNLHNKITKDSVRKILHKILQKNKRAFEIIAITVYLEKNHSALSNDILISYLGNESYEYIKGIINVVKEYLRDVDVRLENDDLDQDYYLMRSKIFLNYASLVLIKDFGRNYASVIKKFITTVSPYKIYHYYIFKRTAYDGRFFHEIFGKDGDTLYKKIYDFERNAYTLQQRALYNSCRGEFQQAYAYIEEAVRLKGNNTSIQNTRAVILFEANKNKDDVNALTGLHDAMKTLEKCYLLNKKKFYHAKKYAEFALYLAKVKNIKDYIEQAIKWLEDDSMYDNTTGANRKDLLKKLKQNL